MRTLPSPDFNAMSTALTELFGRRSLPQEVAPRILLTTRNRSTSVKVELASRKSGYELMKVHEGQAAHHLSSTASLDLLVFDTELIDESLQEALDLFLRSAPDAAVLLVKDASHDGREHLVSPHRVCATLHHDASPQAWQKAIDAALAKAGLAKENGHLKHRVDYAERMYRYLVTESPDIIFILNSHGEFIFVNERGCQLLGYCSDDLNGRHFSLVVHPEDVERARYVFNEKRARARTSRSAELRLRCAPSYRASRTSRPEKLITVAFRSTAVYAEGNAAQQAYCGTYGVGRDVTASKLAEEQLSHHTHHDNLTGLPNRALFAHHAELALLQAKRNGRAMAVMCVDLDRFKLINDILGHGQGDTLIQLVATRLKQCLGTEAVLSRSSGDEFMALLPVLQSKEEIAAIAECLIASLQEPFDLHGEEAYISASIGIAVYPDDGLTVEDLNAHADIATVHMKALGKNGHNFYDSSMLAASHRRINLEQSLRRAIDKGELEMYYQPQIDIESEQIVGAEALIRWHHPERGLLSAGEFLPYAEECGLILAISDWMVRAVCRDIASWNECVETPIRISINLSPHYLDRSDFGALLQAALREFHIAPQQLEVEITENIGIRNPEHALEQLTRLHALGVSIAIDDFGTGYSSLAYLHRFPIHTLKIDKSFVKEITNIHSNFPVVLAIISIAQGLGLHLVAEGVETAVQAQYLQQAGCTVMQGFLFHEPLPPHCLPELLPRKAALCLL